jgi:hypothetical protein
MPAVNFRHRSSSDGNPHPQEFFTPEVAFQYCYSRLLSLEKEDRAVAEVEIDKVLRLWK